MAGLLFIREKHPPPEGPPGGIERMILIQADWFQSHGVFEPVLLTTNESSPFAEEFRALGCPVYATDMSTASLWRGRAARAAREIIREHRVRLVSSEMFRESLVGRQVRLALPSVRHVFRVHTYINCSRIPRWRRRAYHLLDRITQKWVDRFLPICEFNRREMLSDSRIEDGRIRVVHNGIPSPGEPDRPVTDPGELLSRSVGLIARFEEGKQQDVAVRAVARLRGEGLGVRLHLIGDGDRAYLSFVRSEVRRFGVEDQVTFRGYQPRPFDLLRDVPVVALPSLSEGLPTTVIEGMAMRKAVVTTPVGGTGELVEDGVNGLLHRPGDVDALAGILKTLFTKPAIQWEGLRDAARATWRERFSVDRMMGGLLAAYRELGVLGK